MRAYFHLSYDINTTHPRRLRLDIEKFKRYIGCNLLHLGFGIDNIECPTNSNLLFWINLNIEEGILNLYNQINNLFSGNIRNVFNTEQNTVSNFYYCLTYSICENEPQRNINHILTNNYRDLLNRYSNNDNYIAYMEFRNALVNASI